MHFLTSNLNSQQRHGSLVKVSFKYTVKFWILTSVYFKLFVGLECQRTLGNTASLQYPSWSLATGIHPFSWRLSRTMRTLLHTVTATRNISPKCEVSEMSPTHYSNTYHYKKASNTQRALYHSNNQQTLASQTTSHGARTRPRLLPCTSILRSTARRPSLLATTRK